MISLLFAQATAPDPMAALQTPGFLKGLMMFALIVIALVALAWPSISANFKTMVASAVETKFNSVVPGSGTALRAIGNAGESLVEGAVQQLQIATATTAVVNPSQTRTVPDVTALVQQRAVALKNACPNAPESLLLRWLQEGFDPARAQADYIGVLETQLGSHAAVVTNAVVPVPAPAAPIVPTV